MSTSPEEFYVVTGGTVGLEAPSYVQRRADDELYEGLERGEFCYVLTSRQMGKSSLSIRTAERLREEGAAIVWLDLTAIGGRSIKDIEQWYYGLLYRLGEELGLESELERYWQDHPGLPPLFRWMQALRDVALEHKPGPVVIFIDEIDNVRNLSLSTDEFFAAIRECFNRRANDSRMNRLTFCLLGVASPAELIGNANTTPFNIGRRIALEDFNAHEAECLAQGLGRDEETAALLMTRIFEWTGGQPYLMQSLCHAVADDPEVVEPDDVDRLCESMFLTHQARQTDKNLQFVGNHLVREGKERAGLLDLYMKVLSGRVVRDNDADPLIVALRLSGIVRVVDGELRVRNPIYARVFNAQWVRSQRLDLESIKRRTFGRGVLVASLLFAPFLIGMVWIWDHYFRPIEEYYVHFVMRDGAPQGIGLVSPDVARHRGSTYKFLRTGRAGRVREGPGDRRDGEVDDPDAGNECLPAEFPPQRTTKRAESRVPGRIYPRCQRSCDLREGVRQVRPAGLELLLHPDPGERSTGK